MLTETHKSLIRLIAEQVVREELQRRDNEKRPPKQAREQKRAARKETFL